jgi:Predicted AAA-ATPase/PD-(D/E)XK nuclease superfamily
MLQRLPLSYADFRTIREKDYKYIDKTEYIYNLATQGGMFFLARPRRFGKSMTLYTLRELYKGCKDLFKGLWIENHWDFTKIHPVFHLSMKSVNYIDDDLTSAISHEIKLIAEKAGIVLKEKTMPNQFKEILQTLSKTAKVVVLIDEYDAPIIDFLNVDMPKAHDNRNTLKQFYTVLKENDEQIEFVLITGVSKFTKVGVFSGLNNLIDISMDINYASMLGYTQEELEDNFQDHLGNTAEVMKLSKSELLAKMKFWYNGYRFHESSNTVYNPVSTNSLFFSKEFRNFWFETGTPTFLINHLLHYGVYRFELKTVSEGEFSTFDIDNLNTYGLLFQTGYLTIKEKDELDGYTLTYPNWEVERSMTAYLLAAFSGLPAASGGSWATRVERAFLDNDIPTVIDILKTVFKNVPYQLLQKNNEAFYHASIHLLFSYIGIKITSESATNNGRSDALVTTPTHIYIIEFKLDKTPEIAFEQIYNKEYAQAHAHQGKPIIGIGINFSSKTKNVTGYYMADLMD